MSTSDPFTLSSRNHTPSNNTAVKPEKKEEEEKKIRDRLFRSPPWQKKYPIFQHDGKSHSRHREFNLALSKGSPDRRTSPPQKASTPHGRNASRTRVVIKINQSKHQSPDFINSASNLLLDQFQKPLPSSQVSQVDEKTQAVNHLIAQPKNDPSLAQSNASEIEAIVGCHGLSKHYDDDAAIERRSRALAQRKAKKVTRSKIKLDWGKAPATTRFDPAGVTSPAEQAKRLLDAKFQNLSGDAPLSFANERNSRRIDGKFQFVNSYVYRENIKPQKPLLSLGCRCSEPCNPSKSDCECFRTSEGSRLVPYVQHADGVVVLRPHITDPINGRLQEIIECTDFCNCSRSCFNRVVQRGRTIPLQIFMTRRCGFGVRSPRSIRKGQFIDVYLGELLTTQAVEDYENAINEESSSYVFSLDFFDTASYHVQGLHFGSPTRFINHSCNPNARAFVVMMNRADEKIYKLAYFAIRDIPAMKEITFDYNPETTGQESEISKMDQEVEGIVRCLCGERNCRGVVWPQGQSVRRKGRTRAVD